MRQINLVGSFAYDISLERLYLRAFKRLGYKNITVNSNENADVTICFKHLADPNMLSGKKSIIFLITSIDSGTSSGIQKNILTMFS